MAAFRPFDQQAARDELGWPQNNRYVLFPGNPRNPRKGFRLASAAIEHAQRVSGHQSIRLVNLWNVLPEQVPQYMNACDVMIMASWLEGSPNVVKEALACNLPVISVPVGDVPEMLDGITGCRLCSRDPVQLGEK